jgi:3-oxoacyl-[acyl-carrier-protein] synthase I
MLKKVYISNTNCITPLGFDVKTNVENISNGISGIKKHDNHTLLKTPFHAAMINNSELDKAFSEISSCENFTKLEKMMILVLHPIVKKSLLNKKTAFILSTTKGNITFLEKNNENSIENTQLSKLAKTIANFFEFKTEPIVVSNACVSGILAVSVAKRLIQSEMYDDAFVVAGDLVSEFVLSGFNSFQAMSDQPCKPYSINRNGVSLGEATAAVLVSTNAENAKVEILGDGSINDANHISGPSRTGEGLFRSIQNAMKESNLNANDIDYISAHGTATPFNDEMEAISFNRLGLQNVPVNSLKGYYGHTLGASGLLEAVIGIQSLIDNKLYASLGFDELGVSQTINVIKENQDKNSRNFLKTASGFGGCNTAVVFQKIK